MVNPFFFFNQGYYSGGPYGYAYCMYALGVMPLIHKLNTHSFSQMWYADYACACTVLQTLTTMPDWILSARGFWNTFYEQALRVFNPLVKSHLNQTLPSCYSKNENKIRKNL